MMQHMGVPACFDEPFVSQRFHPPLGFTVTWVYRHRLNQEPTDTVRQKSDGCRGFVRLRVTIQGVVLDEGVLIHRTKG